MQQEPVHLTHKVAESWMELDIPIYHMTQDDQPLTAVIMRMGVLDIPPLLKGSASTCLTPLVRRVDRLELPVLMGQIQGAMAPFAEPLSKPEKDSIYKPTTVGGLAMFATNTVTLCTFGWGMGNVSMVCVPSPPSNALSQILYGFKYMALGLVPVALHQLIKEMDRAARHPEHRTIFEAMAAAFGLAPPIHVSCFLCRVARADNIAYGLMKNACDSCWGRRRTYDNFSGPERLKQAVLLQIAAFFAEARGITGEERGRLLGACVVGENPDHIHS